MNTSRLAFWLTALLCTAVVSSAWAATVSIHVPEYEGTRHTYGDATRYVDLDFGMAFSQINNITIEVTGTGHEGAGIITGGLWDPGTYPVALDAEFLIGSMSEYLTDGSRLSGCYFGVVGLFDDTPQTLQPSTTVRPRYQTFLDGQAQLYIESNFIGTFDGYFYPTDPSYVDIESFVITIEGEPAALTLDPDNDGYVGLSDLDLVLAHWGHTVTPGNPLKGDLDGDGLVGLADLDIVLNNWNTATTPAVVVPEPTGFVLLSLGVCALLRR